MVGIVHTPLSDSPRFSFWRAFARVGIVQKLGHAPGGRGCCVRVTGAYKQGCRRRVRLLIHACFKLHYIMNLFHSHRVVTKLIFPQDIIAPLFPIPPSFSLFSLNLSPLPIAYYPLLLPRWILFTTIRAATIRLLWFNESYTSSGRTW